ncbi:MAG: 50S ribosomal protein L13 [Anaerolineae bacterium]|nr:50S ribosomal protein L13 [Anaerolineae bacterium]
MRINTYVTKPAEIQRDWWVVDAKGLTLGRLASQIAVILKGKHKPQYAPNVDAGDYVIVINADRIHVTGKKLTDKMYYRHSMYPGGFKETTLRVMLQKHPERVIQLAVRGMLPKNALGRQMLSKLKVYAGETHPHQAQQPKKLEL